MKSDLSTLAARRGARTIANTWIITDRLRNARREIEWALSNNSEWPADRQTLESILDDVIVAERLNLEIAEVLRSASAALHGSGLPRTRITADLRSS